MSENKITSLLNKWIDKEPQGKARIYRNFVGIGAAVCAILFIIAYAVSFDVEIGYFKTSSFWVAFSITLLVISGILAVSSAFFMKKDMPKQIHVESNLPYFVATFSAFMSIFEAIYRVVTIFRISDYFECFDKSSYLYADLRIDRIAAVIDFITVAACIGTAVAFFYASAERKRSEKLVLIGMFPLIRAILGILQVYFCVEVGVNSPLKILVELALMTSVIAFLFENRMRVSEEYAKPHLYFSAQLLNILFSGAIGISVITFYFVNENTLSDSQAAAVYGEICLEAAFCLISAAYSASRLSSYINYIGKPEEQDETVADTTAEEKTEEPAGTCEETTDKTEIEETTDNADTIEETTATPDPEITEEQSLGTETQGEENESR